MLKFVKIKLTNSLEFIITAEQSIPRVWCVKTQNMCRVRLKFFKDTHTGFEHSNVQN